MAFLGCRPFRVLYQLLAAAELHHRRPARRLDDDVDVVVRAVALGADAPARLPAARGVAGARRGFAEGAVRVLRIFLERPVGETLLVAQLDAAEVEHRVLHGDLDALALAGLLALQQGGQDAGDAVYAGAGIADLRTGDDRRGTEERRVGKECVRKGRARWLSEPLKNNKNNFIIKSL